MRYRPDCSIAAPHALRTEARVIGARTSPTALRLGDFNTGAWLTGDYVRDYSVRTIEPAESILLARYSGDLRGPVLELGCGAGRITRLLVGIGAEVTALDVSPRMVDACRAALPAATVALGDLRDLGRFADGAFGAVVGAHAVLDVLDDESRRRTLAECARVLRPGGVLLFSSHNQAHIPYYDVSLLAYFRDAFRSPRDLARAAYRLRTFLRRYRNHVEARAYATDAGEYAIVNDPVHDHRLAHYYVRRDAQERQLAGAGMTLEVALDRDGTEIPPGGAAGLSPHIHYAARVP